MSRIWWGRFQIKHSIHYAYFDKGGVIQNLLHEIKYKGRKDLAHELGKQFGFKILNKLSVEAFDLIIPVPLHWKRRRQRGYNQSQEIANGLSEILQIPVQEIIRRKRATATQTAKTKVERMKNLESAFWLETENDLSSTNILLLDDVITTGATIENMIASFEDTKVGSISVGALAYTR